MSAFEIVTGQFLDIKIFFLDKKDQNKSEKE